jgi:hypothetical protein
MASSSGLICSSNPLLEDARGLRGFVAIGVEDVPAAKHDVIQLGDRDDVLDFRRPVVRALAQADVAHLRQRPNGTRQPLTDGEDAGDKRGADGAKAHQQHPEFSLCWSDIGLFHNRKLYHC